MTDSDYTLIQALPRGQLEEVAIRALFEAGLARRERAKNSAFSSALLGFGGGACVAAAGFIVGILLH